MNKSTSNPLRKKAALADSSSGAAAAAILIAARTLFAANGFAGTSTRSIAESASVNLAMIHYYFGNKEQLYGQVMEQELAELLRIVGERLEENLPPQDLLAALPGLVLEVHQQRPGLIQLMLQEMTDGAPRLSAVVRELGEHGPLGMWQNLFQLIDSMQGEGFAADLPAPHLLALLFGMSHGLMAFAPMFAVLAKLDVNDPEAAAALGRSAETFVRRALAPQKEVH